MRNPQTSPYFNSPIAPVRWAQTALSQTQPVSQKPLLRALSGHPTFPSRLPLVQLDYVYARGLEPVGLHVPRGRVWWRMSDHLPMIAEFRVPD